MNALLVTAIVLLFLNLVFVVIVLILIDDLLEKRREAVAPCHTGDHADHASEPPVGDTPVDVIPAVDTPVDVVPVPEVPELVYEKSVGRFIDLMQRIEALKKQSAVQRLAFRYLAGIDNDKAQLLQAVKQGVTDPDIKVMFTTLAHDIDAFVTNERPNIDGYLRAHAAEGVDSYRTAISMPEGEPFDADLHIDILDEAAPGDEISRVLALGYRFPHSTIAPYRVKPKVMA